MNWTISPAKDPCKLRAPPGSSEHGEKWRQL